MFLQGLGPMKEASPLSIIHAINWSAISINDPHCIPICLSTINHETLELWIKDVIFCQYCIEIIREHQLDIYILGLHIIASDGHA